MFTSLFNLSIPSARVSARIIRYRGSNPKIDMLTSLAQLHTANWLLLGNRHQRTYCRVSRARTFNPAQLQDRNHYVNRGEWKGVESCDGASSRAPGKVTA